MAVFSGGGGGEKHRWTGQGHGWAAMGRAGRPGRGGMQRWPLEVKELCGTGLGESAVFFISPSLWAKMAAP